MTLSVSIHFFFGIALFLYGILHMEDGIRQVQGRSFKLLLKKSTNTKLRAITSGTLITALLQSSSIVNLTLLSFIGAGTLPLGNALGMVLGANIGGTFNSWLLAWAGFSSGGLQVLALPLVAISGCALVIFRNRKKYQQTLKTFMGLGLLLFGLDYVKESTQPFFSAFDFSGFGAESLIVVLLAGLGVTALTQTSSATVAIVMSVLHNGLIPLPLAISVVLGAELGTTVKIVIASFNGSKAQKQLAAANVVFNLGSTLIGFIFIESIVSGLQTFFGEPILILAAFQTLINVISALLFLPFLGSLARVFERRFKDRDGKLTPYIQSAVPGVPDAATELLEKEAELFLNRVMTLNASSFGERKEETDKLNTPDRINEFPGFPASFGYQEKYQLLKKTEGIILDYYSGLDPDNLSHQAQARCNQLITAIRSAMYSAKGMKDIHSNLNEFSNSGNDKKFNLYLAFKKQSEDFYKQLDLLLPETNKDMHATKLRQLLETVKKNYQEQADMFLDLVSQKQLKAAEIATVFNINREIFSSQQSVVASVKDFLLDPSDAAEFDNDGVGESPQSNGKSTNKVEFVH